MIKAKKVLAIIPARGGSKGVLRKNIRLVGGKPLLARTVESAKASKFIDRLILSSDDNEIIESAKKFGCEVPFKRPKALSTDSAGSIGVVKHAIKNIQERYDYIVLLQVTSPLRMTEDIDACIKLCVENAASSAVSVTKIEKSPYWFYRINKEFRMSPFLSVKDIPSRRQDSELLYELNGAVYVIDTDKIGECDSFMFDDTCAYEMPQNRSLDIDTELDFKILDKLLECGND